MSFVSAGSKPREHHHPTPEGLLDVISAHLARLGAPALSACPGNSQLPDYNVFVTRYLGENVGLWTDGSQVAVWVGSATAPALATTLN